jgi:hypothetical protein
MSAFEFDGIVRLQVLGFHIDQMRHYTSRGHGCGFFKKLKFWIQKRFHWATKHSLHLFKTIIDSLFEWAKGLVILVV